MALLIVLADSFEIDQLVQAGFWDLLSGDTHSLQKFKALIARLSPHDQKTLLYSIIRILSKQHLPTEGPSQDSTREGRSEAIGGVAALIIAIVRDIPTLQDHLGEWLVGVSANAVGQAHTAHRAVIAALSSFPGEFLDSALQFLYRLNDLPEQVTKALQKGMNLFGDKLYIKHNPTLHQEGWALKFRYLFSTVVAKER